MTFYWITGTEGLNDALRLTLYPPAPQYDQTHSLAVADGLLECVWPFFEVGA